jgi:hypothetical protein
MNTKDDASEPSLPARPAPPQTQAEREQAKLEVEHLFRHSLRQGHINPLMHVIMAYRDNEMP